MDRDDLERDTGERQTLQQRYAAYIGHDRPDRWFGTWAWYRGAIAKNFRERLRVYDFNMHVLVVSTIVVVLIMIYGLIWGGPNF